MTGIAHGGDSTLAARIAALEGELAALRQQQRAELKLAIVNVGWTDEFNTAELWDHRVVSPALAAAFDEAGIRSVWQLGKRLRQLAHDGLIERIGADHHNGALWMVR